MLKSFTASIFALLVFLAALTAGSKLSAQSVIDGGFDFDGLTNKAYSLYIPSGYDPGTPHRLMIGFHPLNTARWDAQSWRDTLLVFAESNDLILACPDGGADGAVDDPIDTAFTTALMDSMRNWYNIDEDKIYAIGFSWGGRTTYTYGLSRPATFAGLIPIGAAITNLVEVNSTLQANAFEMPIYIVHGSNDAPSTRFTPVRNALISAMALLEDTLMPGVDHTIDFPNRNEILAMAYRWIDSVNCANLGTANGLFHPTDWSMEIAANLLQAGQPIQFSLNGQVPPGLIYQLTDLNGRLLRQGRMQNGISPVLSTVDLGAGIYLLSVHNGEAGYSQKIVLQ